MHGVPAHLPMLALDGAHYVVVIMRTNYDNIMRAIQRERGQVSWEAAVHDFISGTHITPSASPLMR